MTSLKIFAPLIAGPLQVVVGVLALWEQAYVTAASVVVLLGVLTYVYAATAVEKAREDEEARERSRKAQQRLQRALQQMFDESDKAQLN